MKKSLALVSLWAIGCGGAGPDRVTLSLTPDVLSSERGELLAEATVANGSLGLANWSVRLKVDYTDRNGTAHDIAPVTDKSDGIGLVAASFPGLTWEGAGSVTAELLDGKGEPVLDADKAPITATAGFAVLDQSPPEVSITSPATGAHVPRGRFQVKIAFSDEIGVSQVYVQATTLTGGNFDRTRSSIVASGTTTGTAQFEFDAGNVPNGETISVFAMAADMSGNLAVAPSISLVVDNTL